MLDLHDLKVGDKAIVHLCIGDFIDTVEEIIPDSDREFGFGVVFKDCGLIQDPKDVEALLDKKSDTNSNCDVIQGDCPNCPFADLFGGFCFYYRFYPANIGYGEATCRCEKLKPNED